MKGTHQMKFRQKIVPGTMEMKVSAMGYTSGISLVAFIGWLAPLSAEEFDSFTYEVAGDSVVITDYPRDILGPVDIPPEINGKPVTTIGENAFAWCEGLTSITIPSSVTTIGRLCVQGLPEADGHHDGFRRYHNRRPGVFQL